MVRNTKFQNTWNHVIALFRCLCFSPGSCQFPDDLMFEIFLRLPAKSLLRFRCVSKSIRAMIDSPDFIKEHARRSQKTKSDIQLILVHFFDPDYRLRYVDFSNGNSARARPLKHPCYPHILDMVGCCNGIICLRDHSYDLEGYTLWNPSTRKFKIIESLPDGSHHRRADQVISGFGYDHVKDDYKIMRMDRKKSPHKIQVYSLKSNSWRKLDIQIPVGCYRGYCTAGAFVQAAVHWVWTSPGNPLEKKIAAFHLGSEIFRLMPLPPRLDNGNLALIDLEDQLCIIGQSFYATKTLTKLTIWVMEEYGNKDSWKTFHMDFRNPSAHWQDHAIPLFPVTRGKLIAHDGHKLEWFLTDVPQLKDITAQDLVVLRPDMYLCGYNKLYLCCKTLAQL